MRTLAKWNFVVLKEISLSFFDSCPHFPPSIQWWSRPLVFGTVDGLITVVVVLDMLIHYTLHVFTSSITDNKKRLACKPRVLFNILLGVGIAALPKRWDCLKANSLSICHLWINRFCIAINSPLANNKKKTRMAQSCLIILVLFLHFIPSIKTSYANYVRRL